MKGKPDKYPALNKSYKRKYPFKLGTTSFIYPDHYVPNVEMLGPFLDEIELLLFESQSPEALPSKTVIAELAGLARQYNLTYNIHLPTDVSLSDRQPENQQMAIDTLTDVITRCDPLSPTAYTLHLPFEEKLFENHKVKEWQQRVSDNLKQVLPHVASSQRIAVETLDYPFDLLAGIIDDLDLGVCLDLGHLMAGGYDVKTEFNSYNNKTSIMHLHGFNTKKDHLSLDRLPGEFVEPVLDILRRFDGSLCLEVFSFEDLKASLAFLENRWSRY